jgi:RNA polymerase sigma factor (sigma-70 family)
MIDIVSVGNPKIEYKNHKDVEFETLPFYLNLAKKTISKFAGQYSPSLVREMLHSEDAISSVANCIMLADWRWDSERAGDGGQKKTKYSYRNQCAIWAIKSYLSRKQKKYSKNRNVEVDNDDLSMLDIIPSSIKSPIDILIDEEKNENIQNLIEQILSSNILNERQTDCVRMYYLKSMTFAEIGDKLNITREAVRQNIKKSLIKIKDLI